MAIVSWPSHHANIIAQCDQRKPACSRCERLQIACVGAGEVRYKFIARQSASTSVALMIPKVQWHGSAAILPAPSSDVTIIANAFISALEATPFQTQMPYYGNFPQHIPRRLGHNDGLDSAVCALTSALPALSGNPPTSTTFRKYGKALRHLRVCLSNPTEMHSPETLCAMYLIMVTQVSSLLHVHNRGSS